MHLNMNEMVTASVNPKSGVFWVSKSGDFTGERPETSFTSPICPFFY